jgi:hypothetical protein
MTTPDDNPQMTTQMTTPDDNPQMTTQMTTPVIWVVIWGCHLGLSSGVVIWGVVIWGCHLGLSSEAVIWVVIWGCHLVVVIWGCHLEGCHLGGCHLGLSSGVVIWVVIWGCHLGLSSGGLSSGGCHLGCHLVLSSGMTHSPFYLFIENFIHSLWCRISLTNLCPGTAPTVAPYTAPSLIFKV